MFRNPCQFSRYTLHCQYLQLGSRYNPEQGCDAALQQVIQDCIGYGRPGKARAWPYGCLLWLAYIITPLWTVHLLIRCPLQHASFVLVKVSPPPLPPPPPPPPSHPPPLLPSRTSSRSVWSKISLQSLCLIVPNRIDQHLVWRFVPYVLTLHPIRCIPPRFAKRLCTQEWHDSVLHTCSVPADISHFIKPRCLACCVCVHQLLGNQSAPTR